MRFISGVRYFCRNFNIVQLYVYSLLSKSTAIILHCHFGPIRKRYTGIFLLRLEAENVAPVLWIKLEPLKRTKKANNEKLNHSRGGNVVYTGCFANRRTKKSQKWRMSACSCCRICWKWFIFKIARLFLEFLPKFEKNLKSPKVNFISIWLLECC